jgi:hypothetical protein
VNGPANAPVTQPPETGPMQRQLHGGLVGVQVVGFLMLAGAAAFVVHGFLQDELSDRAADWGIAVGFLLLPGTALVLTARAALSRLARGTASARTFGILAGVFTLLATLPFVRGWGGILGLALGLFTLTAAWLQPRRRVERR